MKLDELKVCPFCNGDTFYQQFKIVGETIIRNRFDGEECDNAGLYDYADFVPKNSKVYCYICNRYLGNKDKNELSKAAEKRLRQLDK